VEGDHADGEQREALEVCGAAQHVQDPGDPQDVVAGGRPGGSHVTTKSCPTVFDLPRGRNPYADIACVGCCE
jgi:hypothetical protein